MLNNILENKYFSINFPSFPKISQQIVLEILIELVMKNRIKLTCF